mmetsp:Transcript_57247/g.66112  ORF Transcript_57247/g.66112 Transcript_57247/m.66112 type:complete len:1455 (-) Transcript_57247:106-4470(-)
MSGITLDHLKILLKEQQEKNEEGKEMLEEVSPSFDMKEAIHEFYQQHGMLAPMKGIWERPIPDSVYKCPLSEPLTTLVQWNSLPRSIQDRYKKPEDGTHGVLEVNRNDLMSEEVSREEGGIRSEPSSSLTNGLQRRPLGGNLTNKLTEYTRGKTGQAKPFIPGGLDAAEVADLTGSSAVEGRQINPYLTPEAIERSLRVLSQGSKESWRDGSLITAPPGVDFKVGISYEDIYGKDDEEEEGNNVTFEGNTQRNDDEEETMANPNEYIASSDNSQRITTRAVQWDQSFLDDDSLFGSSVSDSDSDDDDDDDEDATDNIDDDEYEVKDNKDHDEQKKSDTLSNKETSDTDTWIAKSGNNSDEEIDQLLTEFVHAEALTKNEIIRKEQKDDGTANNPLRLAERQTKLQYDTTRKSWASIALLPIDDFHSYIPNPAMKYPFTLDTFQQQAVARLERNESVFVAAHTSAGKTVVAEYAVSLAKQRGTRCIYTSPIKALSNQKFRDFSLKFGSENVGLITGDLQVNADDSTCLIMTTEILRSMLYRGADLIRDIEFVVFDEVHYINDSERGVVWEEVIIMLPAYVNLIFLSATTPNTFEFSDWIGRTKRRPVYVIKTNYRPVPLSHYLWANLKLHTVKEGNSKFYDKGHQEASKALRPKENKKNSGGNGKSKPVPKSTGRGPQNMAWQAQGSKAQWMSLIRFLEREDLTPSVVFSFSKKKCEEIANMLRSLNLNTASECAAVQGFTLQTVARLSPIDATLPQVLSVCEMVKRGIGIHHGGLLPILKEMVEILCSRNLIKVLFATETFAMGVNMPMRSVVYNSIRKHDGTQFRVLEPGEYTQMAGRAGRRGLDKVGTVIVCCFGEQPPPIGMLRNMLTGQSTMLKSQFRLTYNMILNLLRVEEMSVESMIKRSFSEFATQRALTSKEYPKLLARGQKTLSKLQEQFDAEAAQRIGAEDIEEYFSTCNKLMGINPELLIQITNSTYGSGEAVLQPGRVLLISSARKHGVVRAPALILETQFSVGGATADTRKILESLMCMVLLPEHHISEEKEDQNESKARSLNEIGSSKQRYYGIYEIKLNQILLVTVTKKKIEPSLLYTGKKSGNSNRTTGHNNNHVDSAFFSKKSTSRGMDDPFAGMKVKSKKNDEESFFGKKKSMKSHSSSETEIESAMEVLIDAEKTEMSYGIPLLNMMDCLKRGSDIVELRNRSSLVDELAIQLRSYESHRHRTVVKYYKLLERLYTLQERVQSLSHLLSNESLQLFPDFLHRKAVLKTLGYLDENEAVAVKGRVACEVNTCEELIVTEMVFEGVLNDLNPTEIVAALSALVYQQKSNDDEFDIEVPESLLNCCKQMKTIAINLGQLQKEHGLDLDPIDYAESCMKFGLVHGVYEWAIGVPFSEICQLTDAQEGSIVRCITRLDELCREVRNCARVVGNPTLYRKMEAASTAIKRDIVFAASLYVS